MRHVWKATVQGTAWNEEYEGIWFDSSLYTREEAESEMKGFIRYDDDGNMYDCYIYDGREYSEIEYLGEFEDDEMPMSDADLGY